MALVGMFCIVGVDGINGGSDLIGIVYGLLAAGFYASVILMNKFLKGIDSIEISGNKNMQLWRHLIMLTYLIVPLCPWQNYLLPVL